MYIQSLTPCIQNQGCSYRGGWGGFNHPAFEKIKGICIKMLHLKYIFTPLLTRFQKANYTSAKIQLSKPIFRTKRWSNLFQIDFNVRLCNFKTPFFQDFQIFFQLVTGNSLKPPQFFSFQNISTNMVARAVQNFVRYWLWLAG